MEQSEFICSFCGKTHIEVKKLIAGPKVYICNECIERCLEIIKPEPKKEISRSKIALPDFRDAESNISCAKNLIQQDSFRTAMRHLRSALCDICRGILILEGYPREKYTYADTEWIDLLLVSCNESHIPIHNTDKRRLLTCVSLEGASLQMSEVNDSLSAIEQLFDLFKSRLKLEQE